MKKGKEKVNSSVLMPNKAINVHIVATTAMITEIPDYDNEI